jgi:hypothetical protein
MRLLPLLLLCPALAFGQFASVDNVTLSSVSSGDVVTRWIDVEDPDDQPYPENYVYVDGSNNNHWAPTAIPDGFEGIWIVHTNEADASTSNASLVSFTTSGRAQVCVLWPDATEDPGWLATGSYLDSGRSVTDNNGNVFDMYCAMKDAGALAFGDSASTMYMVTVAPAWRAQPPVNTPSPDENGFYVFATDAYEISEDATTGGGATEPKLRRVTGSDGAVSVDVDDRVATTCSTSDFNFAEYPTTPSATTPVTFSWGDQELGNKFLNIAVADVSADCIIVLEFENATGGISAGSDRQTATITVRDVSTPPPSAGDLFVEIGGSGDDANDCTSGTPCLTIQRAQALAVAGDVIEIQVSGTGTGTYTSCTNFTTSGTSGNEIVLRVRSGDTVNFIPTSCGTSDKAVWEFASGTDYWHLDGSVGTMVCGDPNDFNPVNNANTFSHDMCFSGIADNNYIEINNITMYGGNRNETKCNRIRGITSSHWYIHGNAWSRCGTNNITGAPQGPDTGDLFIIQSTNGNFLIENNTFELGGHDMLLNMANNIVIRGTTFDGDWSAEGTGSSGQRGCVSHQPGNVVRGGRAPHGPALIEKNICTRGGAADSPDGSTAKLQGWRTIFRQNLMCENQGLGTSISVTYTSSLPNSVESQRIYNNTWKNDDVTFKLVASSPTDPNQLADNHFVNNVFDNLEACCGGNATDGDNVVIYANKGGAAQQGYSNDWLGDLWRNNWLHADDYSVRMRITNGTGGVAAPTWPTSVESFSDWSQNFTGNATTRVTFAGYSTVADCNFTGLALAGGSNGIGVAAPLT